MRILHTSDWHLGRTLHGVDLASAHAAFLDFLVEAVREEGVDALLVAGDIYDRALPPTESVALLEDALARLTELTTVVITPGNHDSAPRLGFAAGLFRDRLRILPRPEGIATPVPITDETGAELLVYGMPYLDPEGARDALLKWGRPGPDGTPQIARSHEAIIGAATRAVEHDLRRRRLLAGTRTPAVVMSHSFVVGGAASDSERDISVGGVDSVPLGAFGRDVDYVALGHLHGPQAFSTGDDGPAIRYSGSPLAFSFSERQHRKSLALLEFTGARPGAATLLPTPVPRRLSEITDTMDAVLSRKYADLRDDWVKVTVEQDEFPDGFYAQVKQAFPHALQILHRSTAPRRRTIGPGRETRRPLDVLGGFVRDVAGRDATPCEHRVLADACTAAERAAS